MPVTIMLEGISALTGVAQVAIASSYSQKVTGSTLGQGTYPRLPVHSPYVPMKATNWCFSLTSVFLSFPSSLSKSDEKNVLRWTLKKKKAISVYLAHQPPSFRHENNLIESCSMLFPKEQNRLFLDLPCLPGLGVLTPGMVAQMPWSARHRLPTAVLRLSKLTERQSTSPLLSCSP